MARRGMQFGIFLAPFHRRGENPTLAIAARPRADPAARPARLRRGLDRRAPLGRLGDHRLAGAVHRRGGRADQHIKLGTGVISLPYHHPFMVADRIVQLDHMTRGRVMFGVGPGRCCRTPSCSGIEPAPAPAHGRGARRHHAPAARDEPVTDEDRLVRDARGGLHLRALQRPVLPDGRRQHVTPSGPLAAGQVWRRHAVARRRHAGRAAGDRRPVADGGGGGGQARRGRSNRGTGGW